MRLVSRERTLTLDAIGVPFQSTSAGWSGRRPEGTLFAIRFGAEAMMSLFNGAQHERRALSPRGWKLRSASIVMLASLAVGCGVDERLEDGFDRSVGFEESSLEQEFVSHYVLGASIRYSVESTDRQWNFASTDNQVLARASVDSETASSFTAVGEGTAIVYARPRDADGDEYSSLAMVSAPERFEVHAAPVIETQGTGHPVERAKVLVGSEASFEVHYYRGDTRLAGAGALSIDHPQVRTALSYGGLRSEWIVVAPTEPGPIEVELSTISGVLGTVEFEGVASDQVAGIDFVRPKESQLQDEERVSVLAVATDAEGEAIWGADFLWNLPHDQVSGDTLEYTYIEDDNAKTIDVLTGEVWSSVDVRGEDLSVTESAGSCSVVNPGTTQRGMGLAAMMGLLLSMVGLRRLSRRRSTAEPGGPQRGR